ncbi:MAG: hypothetical protein LBD10_06285 [Desulfobulbus sp.]|jgi:hypothetical protein|uniref:hypothetical protein n=1 Tax=Desulfobulbus sp. TaxID=895 RepID=UPI00284548DC|nr:hypothetical protein [Desulfobulbus sp.]MDR2549786.1 hypothetical protein [Desulfobulbus sp.]
MDLRKQAKIDRLLYSLTLVPLLTAPAVAEEKKQAVKSDHMIVTATRTEAPSRITVTPPLTASIPGSNGSSREPFRCLSAPHSGRT